MLFRQYNDEGSLRRVILTFKLKKGSFIKCIRRLREDSTLNGCFNLSILIESKCKETQGSIKTKGSQPTPFKKTILHENLSLTNDD